MNDRMVIPGTDVIKIGLCLLLLASCHPGRRLDVRDGFEAEKLSAAWSDWRFLPGAVELQSDVVRRGRRACKIVLRPGDQMADEQGTILERAELTEARELVSREGLDYSYSFSVFLPQDFPEVASRLVIAQWKQYSATEEFSVANPVLALRYSAGELLLARQIAEHKVELFRRRDGIKNRWLDLRFHVRFSTREDGYIRAWLNEEEIADYSGVTAYPERYGYVPPNYFYFKMGLYRDHVPETMTIYFDEYRKQGLAGVHP